MTQQIKSVIAVLPDTQCSILDVVVEATFPGMCSLEDAPLVRAAECWNVSTELRALNLPG